MRAALLLACTGLGGCAALTNPVADSLPVGKLEAELRGVTREGMESVPLSLLGQPQPEAYRLDAGDVLGIYVEGVLGEPDQPPPVHYGERADVAPSIGYPIPVREDGTLPLPLIEPVKVKGLTLAEAERAIRAAYTVKQRILKPGRERIIVTLVHPREYRVKVFRQDLSTGGTSVSVGLFSAGGGLVESANRRGAGFDVVLHAYENDLLTALSRTGGLPGTDAINEAIIERAARAPDQAAAAGAGDRSAPSCRPGAPADGRNPRVVRIPLRLPPGEQPSIAPEDVLLHTGDIVFIQSRPAEVFYTAGLLPPGEFPLPRDFDLDVIQAISRVHGPLDSGELTSNNFTGSSNNTGFGLPNASLLTVLRRTPQGGQVRIRVDLNRALRDRSERVLVQPGDVLILQETPGEAIGRYLSEQFKFNLMAKIINTTNVQGTINGVVP